MTISDIVAGLSLDLNDQVPGYEYTRWKPEQLAAYVREAYASITEILGSREDFIKLRVVKLATGARQQTACDCTKILRVRGESTSDGRVTRVLQEFEDDTATTWVGGPVTRCSVDSAYQMRGYSIDKVTQKSFIIIPPVPAGQVRYALIECYIEPDISSDSFDIPLRYVALVKQWALYRALIVDSENNPAIQAVATKHQESYFHLLHQLRTQWQENKMKDEDDVNRGVRAVQAPSNQ